MGVGEGGGAQCSICIQKDNFGMVVKGCLKLGKTNVRNLFQTEVWAEKGFELNMILWSTQKIEQKDSVYSSSEIEVQGGCERQPGEMETV